MDHGKGPELPIESTVGHGLIAKDPNLTIDQLYFAKEIIIVHFPLQRYFHLLTTAPNPEFPNLFHRLQFRDRKCIGMEQHAEQEDMRTEDQGHSVDYFREREGVPVLRSALA